MKCYRQADEGGGGSATSDERIIEALATEVLGWRQVKFSALVTESTDDGIVRFIVNSKGRIETRRRRDGTWSNWEYFSPLTSPADSKMVREKLVQQGWVWNLGCVGVPFVFTCIHVMSKDQVSAASTTEERAVALCALKTVLREPPTTTDSADGRSPQTERTHS